MLLITNETINRAIDYILQHINEELSVEDVAAHCHFSKYYFSRMFKEATGESVYAFMKRLKLEQSAFRLKVEPDRTVTDIGYEFGYSPSNYSWMFRQQYQTNPINFRRNIYQETIRHPFMHLDIEPKNDSQMETFEACSRKIEIKNLPDYFVIYERRIGSYCHLSEQWGDFIEKYQDYVTDDT
ncbi:MAG: AraC family transcriptional regulator, partial [Lachnospiraceae bacterium]|nr:AraC family transcriptional regulator [Lachnospiraceae bacterium]